MGKPFRTLLSPSAVQDPFRSTNVWPFLRNYFSTRTFLVAGALLQSLLSALLPPRLALAPAVLYLLHATVTAAVYLSPVAPSNSRMRDVVAGRSSAQLPSAFTTSLRGQRAENDQQSKAAASSVVVFHFGARFNHPLGLLAPGAGQMQEYFQACLDELGGKNKPPSPSAAAASAAAAEDYGMLGWSGFQGTDSSAETTCQTMLLVFYFRDVEGLRRFAHCDLHRKAWDWGAGGGGYGRKGSKEGCPSHIGFYHETFEVPSKSWETVYVNMQPTLMGRARTRRADVGEADGDSVGAGRDEGEWVSTLVSADHPRLKGMMGRLGRMGT